MSTVRIVAISVAERLADAMAIVGESWAEVGFDFELRPDPRLFAAAERSGDLFALGAFDDAELVGYSTALHRGHTTSTRACSSARRVPSGYGSCTGTA